MGRMSWPVFFKAAVVQAVSIAVLAVVLALALPHSFFESWGWLAGPRRGWRARCSWRGCCACRSPAC